MHSSAAASGRLSSCSLTSTSTSRQCLTAPVSRPLCRVSSACTRRQHVTRAELKQEKATETRSQNGAGPAAKSDAEEATLKYGLEAGLFKVFTGKGADGKSKGQQAKELLTRYGSAYLITSISFAIVSFATCYALVNAGVDVGALLAKVGLEPSAASEKVGTFAIAYAAHKALSPVRFPPTVALTPVVARFLGKQPKEEEAAGRD